MIILKGLRLNQSLKFYFSSIIKTDYPYAFNGISSPPQNIYQKIFLQRTFGSDVFEGFKGAYLSVLNALQQKDKQFLQGILQRRLTNNISFRDVDLYQYDENINVYAGSSFICIGCRHTRPQNAKYQRVPFMMNMQQKGLLMYSNPTFQPQFHNFSPSFPILFGTRIYFSGKSKLQLKGQQVSESEQVHMFQFQIQNTISISKLYGITNIKSKDVVPPQQEVAKLLIGKDYQWKIGDIDNSLNGNLQIN